MNEKCSDLFYDHVNIADAVQLHDDAAVESVLRSEVTRQLTAEQRMDDTPRNANYERVYAVIDRSFKAKTVVDICTCPKCINDVAAFALNCLPPHYYTDGYAYTGMREETGSPWVMVQAAVFEAVERVKENPRHPCL